MKAFLSTLLLLPVVFAGELSVNYLKDSSFLDQIPIERSAGQGHLVTNKTHPDYPYIIESNTPHQMVILDDGLAELEARLQMVQKATQNINVELFILGKDQSSRIFLQLLCQKAREGVKVRLLLDKSPIFFRLSDDFASVMKESGVIVKFYNQSLNPVRGQFRDHKKYISVDGKYALITGRNHTNSYFNMSRNFNYYDRGILVAGEVVKEMDLAFEGFYNHHYSKLAGLKESRADKYAKATKEARKTFVTTEEDLEIRKEINRQAQEKLMASPSGVCNKFSVVSDLPGQFMSKKRMYHEIFSRLDKTMGPVSIETPNFILHNEADRNVFHRMMKRKVDVSLYVNSYMFALSTSAIADMSISNDHVAYWNKKGVTAYSPTSLKTEHDQLFDFDYTTVNAGEKIQKNPAWGIHTKSIIFDKKSFVISSYNLDPRSKEFSSETGVFCDDGMELTALLQEKFNNRTSSGVKFNGRGLPPGGFLKNVGPLKSLLYNLGKIPGKIFEFFI